MSYKIEIWQYHEQIESHKEKSLDDVLKWYKANWKNDYEQGLCTFYVFKDNKEMTFDELNKVGFYEWGEE